MTQRDQSYFEGRFLDGELKLLLSEWAEPGPGYAVNIITGRIWRNGEHVGYALSVKYDRKALGWWVEYRSSEHDDRVLDWPRWQNIDQGVDFEQPAPTVYIDPTDPGSMTQRDQSSSEASRLTESMRSSTPGASAESRSPYEGLLVIQSWSSECGSCGYGRGGWAASPALKGKPILVPDSRVCHGCGVRFTGSLNVYTGERVAFSTEQAA